MAIHFVHAFPNAWFPVDGRHLVLTGISANELAEMCKRTEVISHIRYEDHAARVSDELGIHLEASGVNAPSPFNLKGLLVVASLQPGTTQIQYVLVQDGTAALKESDVRF